MRVKTLSFITVLLSLLFSSTPVFAQADSGIESIDGIKVLENIGEAKEEARAFDNQVEFVNEIYQKSTKEKIDTPKTVKEWVENLEDIDNVENAKELVPGDIIIKKDKKGIGIVKDTKTLYVGTNKGIVEKEIKDFAENYIVYHTAENDFEEPIIKQTSQKKEETITIATGEIKNITKIDKETKEPIANAEFGLYITTLDNKWVKIASIKTKEDGSLSKTNVEYKELVSTKEYNKKEWITNFDKLTKDNQDKYKDLPKEEPEDKGEKTDNELKEELNTLIKEAKEAKREVMLVEESSPIGYVQSNEVWKGKIKENEIILPKVNLLNEKITGEVRKSKTIKLETEISVELKVSDSITKDKINGGKYKVYISNAKGYDIKDSRKASEEYTLVDSNATLKNGVLKSSYVIKPDKPQVVESGKIDYVLNYNEVPDYARTIYKPLPKGKKQAEEKASKKIKELENKVKEDFINAPRKVKIVEVDTPDSYQGMNEQIIIVQKNEAKGTTDIVGSEKIQIDIVDPKGKYVKGAKIKVETSKGNILVKEFESSGKADIITGLINNTSYKITQVEAPQGYVKLKQPVKTITSGFNGNTKITKIVEYKASYTHTISGTHLGVFDHKDNLVDEWVSDKNEHLIENIDQDSDYILREIEAAPGYYKNEDIKFNVSNKDIVLNNDSYKAGVEISYLLDNSEFSVFEESDKELKKPVDIWTSKNKIINLTDEELSKIKTNGSLEKPNINITLNNNKESLTIVKNNLDTNKIETYYTDLKGYEKQHYINNLEKDKSYVIVQTKVPKGYVKTKNIDFTAIDKDQTIKTNNGQVCIKVLDTNNEIVSNVEMDIVDSSNKSVYSCSTNNKELYPDNLQEGNTYTLKIKRMPQGYVSPEDQKLTPGVKGNKLELTLKTAIQRINLVDENNNLISNSRMGLINAEGETVEEWISNKHIIDLPTNIEEELTKNETVKLSNPTNTLKEDILQNSVDLLVKGYESCLPTIYQTTDNQFSGEVLIQMAYELMPIDSNKLNKLIEKTLEKIDTLRGTTEKEKAEKIKKGLIDNLNKLFAEYQEESLNSLKDIESAVIKKSKESSTGYEVIEKFKSGTEIKVDIDLNGNEGAHKPLKMIENQQYTIQELSSAGAYFGADKLDYKVETKENKKVKLISENKIKTENVSSYANIDFKKPLILLFTALLGVSIWVLLVKHNESVKAE